MRSFIAGESRSGSDRKEEGAGERLEVVCREKVSRRAALQLFPLTLTAYGTAPHTEADGTTNALSTRTRSAGEKEEHRTVMHAKLILGVGTP